MITYHFEQTKFVFRQKTLTSKWLRLVAESEIRRIGDISIIFCSDNYILDINRRYLGHDYYTDIITFDTSDYDMGMSSGQHDRISADIVVSLDTVAANAVTYGTGFSKELYRVIIHGVLHLIGYDDLTEADSKLMRDAENKALALLPEFGILADQTYICPEINKV